MLLPDDDWFAAQDVLAYLADYTGLELETEELDAVAEYVSRSLTVPA